MIIRWALCCAVILGFTGSAWAAEKAAPKKAAKAAKTATAAKIAAAAKSAKAAPKKVPLKAAKKPAPKPTRVLLGKTETLTCRLGTEDRHARIGVVLIGDKVDSFAYYSKWKPRTCSIYLQRNRDHLSRWTDKGRVTNVNVDKGLFLIEHGKGEYRFVFNDVDRERYCGMDGSLNGSLTIRRGSERCEVAGIMEEGVPLGQAVAYMEAAAAAAPAPAQPTTVAAAPAQPQPAERTTETSFFKRLAQRLHHEPSPTWRGGVIVGD